MPFGHRDITITLGIVMYGYRDIGDVLLITAAKAGDTNASNIAIGREIVIIANGTEIATKVNREMNMTEEEADPNTAKAEFGNGK